MYINAYLVHLTDGVAVSPRDILAVHDQEHGKTMVLLRTGFAIEVPGLTALQITAKLRDAEKAMEEALEESMRGFGPPPVRRSPGARGPRRRGPLHSVDDPEGDNNNGG